MILKKPTTKTKLTERNSDHSFKILKKHYTFFLNTRISILLHENIFGNMITQHIQIYTSQKLV